MDRQAERQVHEFSVKMRKEMSVLGVREVECFDEASVVLHTQGGEMTVEGSGLRVGTLDLERGIVMLSGKIDAVYYSNDQRAPKDGFWSRLFH